MRVNVYSLNVFGFDSSIINLYSISAFHSSEYISDPIITPNSPTSEIINSSKFCLSTATLGPLDSIVLSVLAFQVFKLS